MLAMSGAAEYVQSLVRDLEYLMQRDVLAEDGGSNVELLLGPRGLHDDVDVPEAGREWEAVETQVVTAWQGGLFGVETVCRFRYS